MFVVCICVYLACIGMCSEMYWHVLLTVLECTFGMYRWKIHAYTYIIRRWYMPQYIPIHTTIHTNTYAPYWYVLYVRYTYTIQTKYSLQYIPDTYHNTYQYVRSVLVCIIRTQYIHNTIQSEYIFEYIPDTYHNTYQYVRSVLVCIIRIEYIQHTDSIQFSIHTRYIP